MRQTRSLVIGTGLELALIKSSLRLLVPALEPATALKKFQDRRLGLRLALRCRFARPVSRSCAAELIAGQKVLHKYNIFCSLVIGAVKKIK